MVTNHKSVPRLLMTISAVAAPVIWLFCTCQHDSGVAPAAGSTITIFDTGGTAPAAGAVVTFYHVDEPACCPASVIRTDEKGSFSTGTIASGIYSIWTEHDSGVCFQDSVIITGDFTTLRNDTLEHPASIAGMVRIEPFHDPRILSIEALGAGKHVAEIDDRGFFSLRGLAGGTWTLLIRTPQQEYPPTYRTITVSAGKTDTISDTLRPPFTGLPAIPIASIRQDTAAGTVTISWSRPSSYSPRDFVIYRDSCGRISMSGKTAGVTTDTFFTDTTFASLPVDHGDTLPRCYTYRVAARSAAGQIGPVWGDNGLAFVPKSMVAPVFADSARHAVTPSRFASINDTVIFSVSARSRTRALRNLIWYNPDRRDTIRTETVNDTVAKSYTSTLRYTFNTIGAHPLHAVVVDDAGSVWTDTITVNIIADAPIVHAGNDTGVFAGEQARLRGSAWRKFGTITGWQWKIGRGEWQKTDGPEIAFTAPAAEEVVVCSLSVVDDDGNTAGDAVRVITSLKCQSVTAGGYNGFFTKSDGSLWGCGMNWAGQLGMPPDQSYVPKPLTRLMDNVDKVDAYGDRTLFLLNDGSLLRAGQSVLASFSDFQPESTDWLVTIAKSVQTMATASYHDLVITTDGTLWGMGINTCGQFGDTAVIGTDTLHPLARNVIDAAAGTGFSIFLTTDHSVYLCGSFTCTGEFDYFGNPDTSGKHWPPTELMRDVQHIAAGNNFCLMLQADGTLWGAGMNDIGQLGDVLQDLHAAPVTIMSGVADMSAGWGFSLILKSDGTLWGCGENGSGQLGDGTTDMRLTPVKIMSDVKSMSAGPWFTLILKKDGSAWACGANDNGQLGDGTRDFHPFPVQIIPSSAIPVEVVAP